MALCTTVAPEELPLATAYRNWFLFTVFKKPTTLLYVMFVHKTVQCS